MNTATITIAGIETKEGTSQVTGNLWRLFKVSAADGGKYSTFDGALGQLAAGSIGKTAEISFESTEKGNNLKTLTIVTAPAQATPPPAPAPQSAQTWPEAETAALGVLQNIGNAPDWELIGLRKTRCALWAAVLSNASLNVAGADALAAFGRELVIAAEKDIFERTGTSAPATGGGDDLDIPFARTFA